MASSKDGSLRVTYESQTSQSSDLVEDVLDVEDDEADEADEADDAADIREKAPFGGSSYFDAEENWSLEWPLQMGGSQAESQMTSFFDSLGQEDEGGPELELVEVQEVGLEEPEEVRISMEALEVPEPAEPAEPAGPAGPARPAGAEEAEEAAEADAHADDAELEVTHKHSSVQFALATRSQSLEHQRSEGFPSSNSQGFPSLSSEAGTFPSQILTSTSPSSSSRDLKSRFRQSRVVSKSLGSLDMRRTVASPMEGGLSKASPTVPSTRFREMVPSAEQARRGEVMRSPAEGERGSSLRFVRPKTSIRPPRSRPVPWVDRREHFGEIRTAQMDLDWDMEGHIPQVSEAAPGFLSAAHLRSEEYWRDLLGLDDEHQAPFHCVQTEACGKFIAACIVIFVLVVGHHDTQELPTWAFQVVHFILAVSFVEICMHLANHYYGAPYKKPEDRSILFLDTIAVFLSCAELWVLPQVLGDALPFSRMVWLVRFLRVLSMIPSLRELTLGIMDALHGLFWVLIFLFIFVYALAVVLTRMVGHHGKSDDENVQEVIDMFSNVGNSMFYLFQLTSQWSLVPLFPLLKASPITCVSFTLFYIYSGWVIVAVMTGTVSFTMISFKERMVQDDETREEEKRHFVKQVLTDIFEQLDSNGDGELDYEEFQALLKSKEVLMLLSENTDINIQDLEDMWQWIDTDKSGSLTIAEFFEGFEMLNEGFEQKTLLRVQERVSGEIHVRINSLEELVTESLDDCCHAIFLPMLKIHAVLEQVQVQLLTTMSLKQQVGLIPVLEETEEDAMVDEALSPGTAGTALEPTGPRCSLASLEARMETQIQEALERIQRFQVVRKPQGM